MSLLMPKHAIIADSRTGRKHAENQDRIVRRTFARAEHNYHGSLIAVLDGVSSSPFGTSIARWLAERLEQDALAPGDDPVAAFAEYWQNLHTRFRREFADLAEMLSSAASVSAAWVVQDQLLVLWAGDSPVYISRASAGRHETEPLTTPHIGRHPNQITRCFCDGSAFQGEMKKLRVGSGDIVTITSDGVIHQETELNEYYCRGFDNDIAAAITAESVRT